MEDECRSRSRSLERLSGGSQLFIICLVHLRSRNLRLSLIPSLLLLINWLSSLCFCFLSFCVIQQVGKSLMPRILWAQWLSGCLVPQLSYLKIIIIIFGAAEKFYSLLRLPTVLKHWNLLFLFHFVSSEPVRSALRIAYFNQQWLYLLCLPHCTTATPSCCFLEAKWRWMFNKVMNCCFEACEQPEMKRAAGKQLSDCWISRSKPTFPWKKKRRIDFSFL